MFGHETVGYSQKVLGNLSLLRKDVYALFPAFLRREDHEILEDIDELESAAKRINTFANFALANVQRNKRTRREESLYEIAKRVLNALRPPDRL